MAERRIITIEFEYEGCDSNDFWAEERLKEAFPAIDDVRVIGVRPATKIVPVGRARSIYLESERTQ